MRAMLHVSAGIFHKKTSTIRSSIDPPLAVQQRRRDVGGRLRKPAAPAAERDTIRWDMSEGSSACLLRSFLSNTKS